MTDFSARLRWRLLSGAIAVALMVSLAWRAMVHPAHADTSRAAAPPASASAPAGLQLTAAQWASLTIATVGTHRFDAVLTADGAVVPDDNATAFVYSQFSGRVVKIYAQPGEHVRKGAPLLSLLSPEAAQARSDIAAAAAAAATASEQLALAKRTEARQQALLQAEAGSEKDWLQSQADRAAAEQALRAAQVALAATKAKSAVLSDSLALDAGAPGQALVTAPIDGTVVQRQVAPGQFLNSLASGGSAPLYTVSDLRSVWVLASVGEVDAARVRTGQPVEISALSLPGRTFTAHVTYIAAGVDPATHRVAVRAELPNPDLALRPQTSVSVRVLDAQAQPGVAVPRGAVVYDGAQAHCYVVSADHTLVARPVRIGRLDGELAEVTQGLAAGAQVVSRGSLFIDRASDSSTEPATDAATDGAGAGRAS